MKSDLFTISIADLAVCLDVSACAPTVRTRFLDHYNAFLAASPNPLYTIRIRIEPGDVFVPFHEGGVWQIHSREHNGLIEFKSHYEQGWMDQASGRAELVMRELGDPENFLRVMYAWLCVEHGGLLVHSSGVLRKSKGYAFFGASGSGKTTVSRLSLNHTVLSDDLVIIRKKNEKFHLYGVPFRGDFIEAPRTNASADLSGLFTLVKDTSHRLETMRT